MTHSRTALKDLLSEISNVRPTLDPEDANREAVSQASGSDSEGQERDHYVDVGASALRKKAATGMEEDPKYSGVKVSRAQLYGDGFGEEQNESEEGDSKYSEQDAAAHGQDSAPEASEASSLEEDRDEGSATQAVPTQNKTLENLAAEERTMLKQLKQAASVDLDKGRDVKKQLVSCLVTTFTTRMLTMDIQTMWDTLAEARIKMQKPLTLISELQRVGLPLLCIVFAPNWMLQESVQEDSTKKTCLTELRNLSEQLFELREVSPPLSLRVASYL